MSFTLVDVALIIIFFGFVFGGFVLGLIRAVGALVGLAAGTIVAGNYFYYFSDRLSSLTKGNSAIANIASFILLFIVTNRLVVLVFHLIDKIFHFVAIIPFLKSLNRIGGVILGAIEGVLTLGLIIFVISKLAPDSAFVSGALNNSQFAHWLVSASRSLIQLLPPAFDSVKSLF